MKKKARFLSALLALALCLTCMALPAFAEGEEPAMPEPEGECTCVQHCNSGWDLEFGGANRQCVRCYNYYRALIKRYGEFSGVPSWAWVEIDRVVSEKCPVEGGASSGSEVSSSAVSSGKPAPDVSGKYRTTAERLHAKLNPVEIAQQELCIDPVTNTIGNLYDADGNLITATLSSDGHFYIVPDSSGEFVYIPTGR